MQSNRQKAGLILAMAKKAAKRNKFIMYKAEKIRVNEGGEAGYIFSFLLSKNVLLLSIQQEAVHIGFVLTDKELVEHYRSLDVEYFHNLFNQKMAESDAEKAQESLIYEKTTESICEDTTRV